MKNLNPLSRFTLKCSTKCMLSVDLPIEGNGLVLDRRERWTKLIDDSFSFWFSDILCNKNVKVNRVTSTEYVVNF